MMFLFTCEHSDNQVPDLAAGCLDSAEAAVDLQGYRSWDAGALAAARRLARGTGSRLISNPVSRLVVDVNRSPHHRQLFSKYSKSLDEATRSQLLDRYYFPYRRHVQSVIQRALRVEPLVIHVAVHSFASVVQGEPRRTDVGLLYDPARQEEVELCLDWHDAIYDALPMIRVRRNYPRRGTSDSLVKSLRQSFAADRYVGVEIHLNQAWCARRVQMRREVFDGLAATLSRITGIAESEAA